MTVFRRVTQEGDPGPDPQAPAYRLAARLGATDVMLLRELAQQIIDLVSEPGAPGPGMGGTAGLDEAPAGTGEPAEGSSEPAEGSSEPAEGSSEPAEGAGDAGLLGELEREFGREDDTRPPADPALARLLPDAYRDDPGAASEFRRYTEADLRAGKVAAAGTLLATLPEKGGRVILSPEEGEAWLRSLNDIRLALGVRLSITQETAQGPSEPHDPNYAVFAVYDWLTGIQDSLVQAMS